MAKSKVLTIKEVAEFLDLNEATIYRLVNSGEIPGKKIGRVWRFSKKVVNEWFEKGHFENNPGEKDE